MNPWPTEAVRVLETSAMASDRNAKLLVERWEAHDLSRAQLTLRAAQGGELLCAQADESAELHATGRRDVT